jgi:uncharacterized Zn-binding protein involved in type VI secretion
LGKPAARLGDTTAHGGAIIVGAPTVFIGGAPAARMNDMHLCPLLNPGTPPPPHVGQQILIGSPTVLICGQMAARMGDQVMCSGPPDVIVGGCPTVLIGESAGGGGGAGGPAGAITSASIAGNEADNEGGHFLDVKFTDKTGKPVKGAKYAIKTPDNDTVKGSLSGQIKKTGVKQGNYEIQLVTIVSAKWERKKIKADEKAKLKIQTAGFDSGTKAAIDIWQKNLNRADQKISSINDKSVSGDKVEAEWEFEYPIEDDEPKDTKPYSSVYYYFTIKIGQIEARSDFLEIVDSIEIELKNDKNKPIANADYMLFLANGEVRQGKLDKNGYKKEEIPAASCSIIFPELGKLADQEE